MRKATITKELLVIVIACVVAFSLSVYFDLFEALDRITYKYERYQLDELLFILILITISLAFFSYFRYADSRKEAAERQHIEHDRNVYEKIVMASNDAMTFVGRDYRFRAVNNTMINVWGRTDRSEFIGHHVKEFLGEELFSNHIKAVYDRCFSGEQVVTQQWYEFEGFSRRYLYFIYNPYFEKDGTVTGAVVVATNLTELKETEEALRKSEEKFRKLFDLANNPAALIRADDRRIIDINDKYVQFYGHTREDALGKPFHEACWSRSPEDMKAVIKELSETGGVTNREVTALSKDGSAREVLFSASTIELEGQEYILVSTQDISDIKAAEKKIKNSLREKEVLLKEIHHRVKNNMAVISSFLSLQSKYVEDSEYLKMIRESRDRISSMALVHEQLYRAEDFSHIDVREYVSSLIANIQDSHDIGRRVDVEAGVDEIYLDIDNLVPLGLIMNEIMVNAFKHAFKETERPAISLSMKKAGERNIILAISDNGSGFPEGFDPERSSSLGLQLVSILSSQINGQMDLSSERGVRFNIVFPEKLNLSRDLAADG